MLRTYLSTSHDIDVETILIESGTLQVHVVTRSSSRAFLQLVSWKIIQDLAGLLQLLGPNTEVMIDIIGTEEYALDLLVLSEDGSMGYRSNTDRETFNSVQGGAIDQQQWELLAGGQFEDF